MKLYKVFTAGKHGKKNMITADDLKEIADNYDPEYHEAPLTLDHKTDGGALGWVKNVIHKGQDLFVEFSDVNEIAKKLTGSGEYKRPSIEIQEYEDKGQYLRAVSLVLFPAVKGLPAMKFSEDGTAKIFYSDNELEFNESNKSNNMEITKFAEIVGLTNTATEEEVLNAFSEKLTESATRITSLEKSVSDKDAEIKKFKEYQIDTLVQTALSAGKIVEAQKESMTSFANSDYDSCQKYLESLPVNSIYQKDEVSKKAKYENGKEVSYSDILKDPVLANKYSEEDLKKLREEYMK